MPAAASRATRADGHAGPGRHSLVCDTLVSLVCKSGRDRAAHGPGLSSPFSLSGLSGRWAVVAGPCPVLAKVVGQRPNGVVGLVCARPSLLDAAGV